MRKKTLAWILTLAMVMCLVPSSVFAAPLGKIGSITKVSSFTQTEGTTAKSEQITATTSGTTAKISIKTKVKTPGTFVVQMKPINGGSAIVENCTPSVSGGVYSGTVNVNFSGAATGIYQMYVWRGTSGGTFGASQNKGMLSYSIFLKYSSGSVGIVQYSDILNKNKKVYAEINTVPASAFKDASLDDIRFLMKAKNSDKKAGKPLTSSQKSYIKSKAKSITSGASSDYDKVKKIYEWVAEHVYYDNTNGSGYSANPYTNIKKIYDKTSSFNSSNGRVATQCVGYAAMEIAMARSLGIPARLVEGKHSTNSDWSKAKSIKSTDHKWAEFYVNGKWIMADSNMGTSNNYEGKSWKTPSGLSNYNFLEATQQQIATNYIVHGLYVSNVENLKTDKATDSLKVKWKGHKGISGYQILIYKGSKKVKSVKAAATATSKTVSGLSAGTKYTVKVKAYAGKNLNSNTSYSDPAKVSSATKPKKATIASATSAKGSKALSVKWKKINCTGYRVEISKSQKFKSGVKTKWVTGKTSAKFTGLKKGSKYYVRVTAYVKVAGYKTLGKISSYKLVTIK